MKKKEDLTSLVGVIKAVARDRGITNMRVLASRAGFTAATFYARMKNPENFTLGEIKRMEDVLRIKLINSARVTGAEAV